MSADKRSVSTDALDTLGMIINENEKRDAIHLAVIPVQAGDNLLAGQHVTVDDQGLAQLTDPGEGLGIVDPFLGFEALSEGTVKEGEWFWLVIYPRQITSLRHVWSHPAFDNSEVTAALPVDPVKRAATERLINGELDRHIRTIEIIADSIGARYHELMEEAKYFVETGDYWVEGGRFEGEYIPDEFWDSFTFVTGISVPSEKQHSFLSCSC